MTQARKTLETQLNQLYELYCPDPRRRFICYYCGLPAGTVDHVPPLNQVLSLRAEGEVFQYLKVPSCLECNVLASDEPHTSLLDRAAFIKDKLRAKYRRVLGFPDWDDEEIDELGERLRQMVLAAMSLKYLVVYRVEYGMGRRYSLKDLGYLNFDPTKVPKYAAPEKWDKAVADMQSVGEEGDFLYRKKATRRDRFYADYDAARLFVRDLKLRTSKEYIDWYRENPGLRDTQGLHGNPPVFYGEEWRGWDDYLGPSYSPTGRLRWVTYSEARDFASRLGLNSQSEWATWCSENKELRLKRRIPASPRAFYEDDWTDWNDFLGIESDTQEPQWASYVEACQIVGDLGFKRAGEFQKWASENPEKRLAWRIPANLRDAYKGEWKGWPDFLGIKSMGDSFVDYQSARRYARGLGLVSATDWGRWSAENKAERLSARIPANPRAYYGSKWISWEDFLGVDG